VSESNSQRKKRLAREHNERHVLKQQYKTALHMSAGLPCPILPPDVQKERKRKGDNALMLALASGAITASQLTKRN